MKITRAIVFRSPFGRIEFIPHGGAYRVHWTPVGQGHPGYVGWLKDDQNPNAMNARFFIRKAVAEDRGLPPYTFTDKNLDPPTK